METTERKPLPPPEAELTLDEAAQQLREYWGYPMMTDYTLYLMIKKLDWGPPGHFREGVGWYMIQKELLSWLRREEILATKRRELKEEEEAILSARGRPLWHVVTPFEGPDTDDLREVLGAYGCDTAVLIEVAEVARVLDDQKPDAVFVNAWRFSVADASLVVEAVTTRGIYCVLCGVPEDGELASALIAKCSEFDGRFAWGDTTSSLANAPAKVARRMNLNAGLAYEQQLALKHLKDAAWNGYGSYGDDDDDALPVPVPMDSSSAVEGSID